MITEKDAEQSDFKNMLTRSVGVGEDVEVDLLEVWYPSKRLYSSLLRRVNPNASDEKILALFQDYNDPDKIAAALIEGANKSWWSW